MTATGKTAQIRLQDAAATERLGFQLAKLVCDRAIVALLGPLGAGKTTFAKGAGRALGVEEVINSPTFTMLNEYLSGRIPLYHLDLYRVRENADDEDSASQAALTMIESELDELTAGQGLVLIEWADFFDAYMQQQDYLRVELNYSKSPTAEACPDEQSSESGRTARITAHGPRSSSIVDALSNVYFS